jgi:hypothetical protein
MSLLNHFDAKNGWITRLVRYHPSTPLGDLELHLLYRGQCGTNLTDDGWGSTRKPRTEPWQKLR